MMSEETTKETSAERFQRNTRGAYGAILVTWGLCAYSEIFRYLQEGTLFTRKIGGKPSLSDFVQWYNAGVVTAACRGGLTDIYDPQVQMESMKQLVGVDVAQLNFYTQYPPVFFALMRPFAALSMTVAYFVWCLLALPLIIYALWATCKEWVHSKAARFFVFAGTLGSFPAWYSFEVGQTALYQFALNAFFWLSLKHQKHFQSGLLAGLCLVKLQYLPVLLLCGTIFGRIKFLAGFAASAVVLGLYTLSQTGWRNIIDYPKALAMGEAGAGVSGVSPHQMQNFRGEMVLFFGGETHFVHVMSLLVYAAALLFVAILWLRIYPRLKQSRDNSFEICAAFTLLLMLIASPHTHKQEFLSVILPLVWLYPREITSRNGRWLRGLIIGYPVLSWVFFILEPVFLLGKIEPYFLWTLVLITTAVMTIRSKQSSI